MRPTWRRAIGALVLILVAGALGSSASSGRLSASVFERTRCHEFRILAVPGAGETGPRGGTAGEVSRRIGRSLYQEDRDGMLDRSFVRVVEWSPPRLTVGRLDGVRRDALSAPYFDGWRLAADETGQLLRQRATQCRDEAQVVVGYSQGATVARKAIRDLPPTVRGRIAGVVMVGDPTALTHENARRYGARRTDGLVNHRQSLPGIFERGRTLLSWCVGHDPLCRATRSTLSRPERGVRAHRGYAAAGNGEVRRRLAQDLAERIGWIWDYNQTELFQVHWAHLDRPLAWDLQSAVPNPHYVLSRRRPPPGVSFDDGSFRGTPVEPGAHSPSFKVWSADIAPKIKMRLYGYISIYEPSVAGPDVRRITRGTGGAPANGDSAIGQVSGNGEVVVFSSDATNLVPGDHNAARDVFVWERATGATTLISRAPSGVPASGASQHARVSTDGRFVVFESVADDLVAGDVDGLSDVFVWDRVTMAMTTGSHDVPAGDRAELPWVSADGSEVVFSVNPTGRYDPGVLHSWDASTGASTPLPAPFPDATWLNGGAVGLPWVASADGRYAALEVPGENYRDELAVWDRYEAREVGRCGPITQGPVLAYGAIADDGGRMYASWDELYSKVGLSTTRLCEPRAGTHAELLQRDERAWLTSDGRGLVVLEQEHDWERRQTLLDLKVRNLETGSTDSAFRTPALEPSCAPFLFHVCGLSISSDAIVVGVDTPSPNVQWEEPAAPRFSDIFVWERSASP